MAFKKFILEDGNEITVYKRRGSRNLRLSVVPAGGVRVSIPAWAPYKAGIEFARSKHAWIRAQRQPQTFLYDGQPIGKAHHLKFVPAPTEKVTTRLRGTEAVITYPLSLSIDDAAVQTAAQKVGIRALRNQAEALLPQRIRVLADTHGFTYRSVSVKQLTGRWGSCDHQKNIVLNLFLMQMPWDCIDYVMLHELAHTEVLKHGPDFWAVMERVLPDAKALRRTVRDYQPKLQGRAPAVA